MVPYTTNPNPDPSTPNNDPDHTPIHDPNLTPYVDPDLMDDETFLKTLTDNDDYPNNNDFDLDDSLPIDEINLDNPYHTGITPLNTNHDNTNATTDQDQHENTMQHAPNINNLTANMQINHNPTNTNTPDSNQVNNNLQDKTDPLDITPPNTNKHHDDISIATTDHNQQENTMQHALNTDTESNFNPSNTQNTNYPTNTNTSDSNQSIPPHLLTPFELFTH